MKTPSIILLILIATLLSCKKKESEYLANSECLTNSDCLTITSSLLIGEWLDNCNMCFDLGGRTYDFNFVSIDSFLLHKQVITDVVYFECGENNIWDIYAKGSWSISNNKILLTGIYCDENYNELQYSPCPEMIDTGEFKMEFNKFTFCDDILILQDTTIGDWNGLVNLRRK